MGKRLEDRKGEPWPADRRIICVSDLKTCMYFSQVHLEGQGISNTTWKRPVPMQLWDTWRQGQKVQCGRSLANDSPMAFICSLNKACGEKPEFVAVRQQNIVLGVAAQTGVVKCSTVAARGGKSSTRRANSDKLGGSNCSCGNAAEYGLQDVRLCWLCRNHSESRRADL